MNPDLRSPAGRTAMAAVLTRASPMLWSGTVERMG
jgi:hypothetical protein